MQAEMETLYRSFSEDFLKKAVENEFFTCFENAVSGGTRNITAFEKFTGRRIDMKWVEAFEAVIRPLDNIIRNPRSFIKREENIVPIETARVIGPESIRHLSRHTDMIRSVENGRVTPSKILSVTKDDSLDTYENRFIMTLLIQMEYFLDKRMGTLMKGVSIADEYEYGISGECTSGTDNIKYTISMSCTSPNTETDIDDLINADISKLTGFQRVERLRAVVYSFRASPMMKALYGVSHVRPPLTMTNVLKKNPDFVQCVEFWGFLGSYEDKGFDVEFIERNRTPEGRELKELQSLVLLQYMLMKKHTGKSVESAEATERKSVVLPNYVRHQIDEITESFDFSVDEVRRVFILELDKKAKAEKNKNESVNGILDRLIKEETNRAKSENQKRIERAAKRERLKKEAEEKRIAEEIKAREKAIAETLAAEESRKAAEAHARRIELERKTAEGLAAYERKKQDEMMKKQESAKYSHLSRKKKKSAQKRDGVFEKGV